MKATWVVCICALMLSVFLEKISAAEEPSARTSIMKNTETIDRISREIAIKPGERPLGESSPAYKDNVNSSQEQKHGWSRHPIWYGVLVGCGAGFAIGAASGDGGFPFNDGSWLANGLALAGVGAASGAVLGAILR